jgi:DNA polymerase
MMTALTLDTRQRAMLKEMGIPIWLPVPVPVPAAEEKAKPVTKPRPPSVPAPATPTAAPPEPVRVDFADAVLPHQQADWFIVSDALDPPHSPDIQSTIQLLDNLLKAAGISRSESGAKGAYLSNAAQYRTSNSVKPNPQELEHCRQWVAREIAAVRPRIIVAMGTFAIQLMLEEHPHHINAPLDKQRGTIYSYQDIPVVPSYSHRVLLRSNSKKAKAWADWCLALDRMENPLNRDKEERT